MADASDDAATYSQKRRSPRCLFRSSRQIESTTNFAAANSSTCAVWGLPEEIVFHIVTFVAAPTTRATVLCHQIAPLCRASYRALLNNQQSSASLWDKVLREDYGVSQSMADSRRSCKRLRRCPVERVRDAHVLIQDNTEIAYFYLSEMVQSRCKGDLTRSKMCRLLDEYGPHLRTNTVVSSGGTYLVEVCRARNVKESTILACVKELVESRGAQVDVLTRESPQSSQTALCVAAARGMSTIVQYLLQVHSASRDERSSGRFRLHTAPKKTISFRFQTALEIAEMMKDAESKEGATAQSLVSLNHCIRLLREDNRI
ncbi:predicted protein [Phaeodactylum tricornutum CCAP 1055/1]|jgi:hypothetical protein|uniref:Ankyrin repeat protein n=1 Tax=Phaeodactylum tricornutum (strain CCAP 1055/1) TaxID=556484 RepID=B7GAF7_PHATC|nr:predicted protein [Phaeodactylum tricornutum CCAP 1055/1]EEC44368.1 predicted protein [Phaeodactylum tricornutum CCAP 1055/1]|eukprot:XP_002184190.1 predicted protein [Phaeodactylum tricornutum CCAP 1055/1]